MSSDEKLSTIRIEHRDNALDIIDKVNEVLKARGMMFEDDNLEHDGFCVFAFKLIEP